MTGDSLYASKAVWIAFFLALYAAYCIFWGVTAARRNRTAVDFFVAGRRLPIWAFVMGVTVSSFAGWLFVAQPALILRDGLPAGYLAFAAIVMPLAAALLFKRQWMLSRRFGFVTPGEMLAGYFGSDVVRVFTAIVAFLFAIPFLGLLLSLSGSLVSVVSDGALSRDAAMWALAALLLIHVTLGGLRAVAHVAPLQALLTAAGVVVLGLAGLHLAGGFEALTAALDAIARSSAATWGTTLGYGGGDHNGLFAVPGVVQWTDGLGKEMPAGGPWTGLMVMSFLLVFAGLQAQPASSLWAFSSRTPDAFAHQQVWASACAAGVLLFVFAALQGLGALALGGNGAVAEAGLSPLRLLPPLERGNGGQAVAALISLVGQQAPWLAGLLTLCFLAAVKAAAGTYMAAVGAVATRDLYMRFFDPGADVRLQKRFARIVVLLAAAAALVMATFATDTVLVLGALALALSVQLLPALLGMTWIPRFTRRAVEAGLVVGCLVAAAADPLGQHLTRGGLPWGQWPWTVHAACWGLAANLLVCALASVVDRDREGAAHRSAFHRLFDGSGEGRGAIAPAASPGGRRLAPLAWTAALVWAFFAIGPGIVLGNGLFGDPGSGRAGWDFDIPSIWAWQLLWWGLGVLLIWFLAFKMGLSTAPAREVVPLCDDVADAFAPQPHRHLRRQAPQDAGAWAAGGGP